MTTRGKSMKTTEYYVVLYDPELNFVYTKSGWYTSKTKAKQDLVFDGIKFLAITTDIVECLELKEKYERKFSK